MLFFLTCLFLILEGSTGDDNNTTALTDVHDVALVSHVEDTLGECSTIVEDVGDFVHIYENDDESRRRNKYHIAEAVQVKLQICTAIVEAVDTFRQEYIPWSLGSISLRLSELDFIKKLLSQISKGMGNVLYVATRDGDASTSFHSACDDEGPTIVIVESTTGAVFGGYSDLSWGVQGSYATTSNSFLFRVRPAMTQYGIISGKEGYAVYRRSGYGPTFGGGHDLYIANSAMGNSNSYTNAGHSYTFPSYPNYQLLDGQKNFQVKDYVVLKVI
jgi:hypothetical protein